jgi:hypothetical protein
MYVSRSVEFEFASFFFHFCSFDHDGNAVGDPNNNTHFLYETEFIEDKIRFDRRSPFTINARPPRTKEEERRKKQEW